MKAAITHTDKAQATAKVQVKGKGKGKEQGKGKDKDKGKDKGKGKDTAKAKEPEIRGKDAKMGTLKVSELTRISASYSVCVKITAGDGKIVLQSVNREPFHAKVVEGELVLSQNSNTNNFIASLGNSMVQSSFYAQPGTTFNFPMNFPMAFPPGTHFHGGEWNIPGGGSQSGGGNFSFDSSFGARPSSSNPTKKSQEFKEWQITLPFDASTQGAISHVQASGSCSLSFATQGLLADDVKFQGSGGSHFAVPKNSSFQTVTVSCSGNCTVHLFKCRFSSLNLNTSGSSSVRLQGSVVDVGAFNCSGNSKISGGFVASSGTWAASGAAKVTMSKSRSALMRQGQSGSSTITVTVDSPPELKLTKSVPVSVSTGKRKSQEKPLEPEEKLKDQPSKPELHKQLAEILGRIQAFVGESGSGEEKEQSSKKLKVATKESSPDPGTVPLPLPHPQQSGAKAKVQFKNPLGITDISLAAPDAPKCCACKLNAPNVMNINCGHKIVCLACVDSFRGKENNTQCPICAEQLELIAA